jgi:hypothetical protein
VLRLQEEKGMRRATLKVVVAGRGAMPAGQAVRSWQLPAGVGHRSFTTAAAASSTEATQKYDFINVRCGSLI